METKVNPSAAFNDVVLMLSEAESDYRNMAKALKATYDVLKAVKDQPGNQEICTKLAVILTDALEAGAGKGPTHSILYYRDITSANMPEPVAKAITAAGSAYQYCAGLYGKLRALYAEWAGASGVATTTAAPTKPKPEPEEKTEEPAGETEEGESPELTPNDDDEADGDEDPEPEPAPTPPPTPKAKARVKPVPVQDASVESGPSDGPQVNEIEPTAEVEAPAEAAPEPTPPPAPADDEDVPDEDVEIVHVYKEVRKIRKGIRLLGKSQNAVIALLTDILKKLQ